MDPVGDVELHDGVAHGLIKSQTFAVQTCESFVRPAEKSAQSHEDALGVAVEPDVLFGVLVVTHERDFVDEGTYDVLEPSVFLDGVDDISVCRDGLHVCVKVRTEPAQFVES